MVIAYLVKFTTSQIYMLVISLLIVYGFIDAFV